jgi:uncharacterized protein (DUF433 family)
MDYSKIITIEPGKMGGKPCIRSLRITVYDVLDYLASEMTEEEILRDFPDLTAEDLRAAISFAADRERRLTAQDEPPTASRGASATPVRLRSNAEGFTDRRSRGRVGVSSK